MMSTLSVWPGRARSAQPRRAPMHPEISAGAIFRELERKTKLSREGGAENSKWIVDGGRLRAEGGGRAPVWTPWTTPACRGAMSRWFTE